MSTHALLAPSFADVWFYCPGSVQLAALVPETDRYKQESDEGDAAHWVCQQVLEDCIESGGWRMPPENLIGQTAPNGVIVTQEMAEGARMYLEEIHPVASLYDYQTLFVEQPVETDIHPECRGTPDAALFDPGNGRLHIWDYKFGHGSVRAFENKQLLCYYDGIRKLAGITGLQDQALDVYFNVIQPRDYTAAGPVKEWTTNAADLRNWLNRLSAAAHKALSEDAECITGPHCKHCPARHECPALAAAAAEGIAYRSSATPQPLSDAGLAAELMVLEDSIRDLEYRKDAMQEEALSRLGRGVSIPGYSAKHGTGNRDWTGGADAEKLETARMLADAFGVSLDRDPAPVTPAEAERRLKVAGGMTKQQAADTLDGFVTRPTRGLKLVRDDAVTVRQIFSTGAK